MSLKNTIIFITGASSGIGRSCARAFAREEASILMTARRADRLIDLAAAFITEYGVPVHHFALDVRRQPEVERALTSLPEAGKTVDVRPAARITPTDRG